MRMKGRQLWRLEGEEGTGKSLLVPGGVEVARKELGTRWLKQQEQWCSLAPLVFPHPLLPPFPWQWAQVQQLYLLGDWLTLCLG